MIEVWRHALEALRAGERAVLLVVVDHSGSVPGKPGAKAVVAGDRVSGTIGGGIVEKELCELARRFDERAQLVHYDHGGTETDSICSGSQDLVVLGLGAEDEPAVAAIVATLDDDRCGLLKITPEGLGFDADTVEVGAFSRTDSGWIFTDPLGRLDTLTIIGGGHVALALSRLMATLPFRIVVLDDRLDVPTMAANTWAAETLVIDYSSVAEHVAEGDRSWVAIMTHAHRADATVLERLAGRNYAYLGMMGSRAKVATIFAQLEANGIARAELENVHAPIGVSIRSHTPAEIAVSIAAEIIDKRNRSRSS